MAYRRLDQILRAKGRVTDAQITRALRQQSLSGGRLGEHLLSNGDVNEADLIDALSEQLHVRGVTISQRSIDSGLFDRLPLHVAEQNLCLPISFDAEHDILNVAFADPLDRDCVRAVERVVQPTRVRPLVALATYIHAALVRLRSAQRDTTAKSRNAESASDDPRGDRLTGCLELLELALSARQSVSGSKDDRHIDRQRLIHEVSVRMGLVESDIEDLRLAALALSIVESTTQDNLDDIQLSSRAAAVLRAVGLSQAALIHEELAQATEAEAPLRDPCQILTACQKLVVHMGGDDITEANLASWRDDFVSQSGQHLSSNIVDCAIEVLLGRYGQERLLHPAAELLLVGDGDISGSVNRLARARGMRVVRSANLSDAIASCDRRRPDLVCLINPRNSDRSTTPRQELERLNVSKDAILLVSTSPQPELPEGYAKHVLQPTDDNQEGSQIVEQLLQLLKQTRQVDDHSEPSPPPVRSEPVMSGSLSDLAPADLIQVLCTTQKTVRVDCVNDHQRATLWFHGGHIIRAESTIGSAEIAFYHLVGWSRGRFEVYPLEDIPGTNICTPTTALLLEALRRIDEQHGAARTLYA